MTVSYPDIIGEYINTTERFAIGNLQFAGYFEPAAIAPEEVTNLYLLLQNTSNVPITVNLQIAVPKSGGFFSRKKPLLALEIAEITVEMSQAEAGLLVIPVTTTDHVKQGEHTLTLTAKVQSKGRGKRIRPSKSKSKLPANFIDTPVGLNLVSSLGATYTEKSVKKALFPLKVSGKPEPLQRAPKLKYSYETIWIEKDIATFNQSVKEINSRQVKMKDEMEVEKLFVNLYSESVSRFSDAGLPLRIGEAIVLAKMLTFSCHYFLSSPQRSNGLLVPIWERALDQNIDTSDTLHVLRTVGYYHVLRLAIAMSFGVMAKGLGRHYWSIEERQAVADHISDSVEAGQSLDLEFLYLPLLMGGTQIASKVRLQGENTGRTLALMKAAREARTRLFLDEDMSKADKVYNKILRKALA